MMWRFIRLPSGDTSGKPATLAALYTRRMGLARIVVVIALAGAGCSGGSLSGDDFATTPGSSVLTSAVRTVILTSLGGGFHGGPPAGAACDPSQWSYLLSPEAKRLAFSGCRI